MDLGAFDKSEEAVNTLPKSVEDEMTIGSTSITDSMPKIRLEAHFHVASSVFKRKRAVGPSIVDM